MKNKIVNNAAWMISCRIVQAILQLMISMLTARYLGPSDYGLINYAASLVAFFTPLMQLGLNGILVQEIVNHSRSEETTMGTAILMNAASGALCMVGLIAFSAVTSAGETETTIVCALYSISILMEAVHILQYWFQAKLMSKYTSLAMLAAYAAASVYQVMLLIARKSIRWFAVSKALDIAVIDVILLVMYHRCGGQRLRFSFEAGRDMLSRSKYYILANMMVVIFAQTDRIMLKMMMGDAATGYYSAAVACAGMTAFVFGAIIDSMQPGILESKNRNHEKAYCERLKLLYTVIVYLSLLQCVAIAALAPVVIGILYGPAYQPAVSALRIIIGYTTFSYLGAVRNVWILAENKHHLLWRVNMSGAAANVVLNYLLIPHWGVNGAAFASLITQFFTNVMLCFVYKELRPAAKILLESLSGKSVIKAIRGLQKKTKME